MDFLLASYRKQKKWIVLRQLLLLLARLAVAALLIAMLCGWTGGRQLLGALGGQSTHHVIILDDSYSMADASAGATAYERSLKALEDLTRRLASDDGHHQLTVMRASRAAMAVRGGRESGDAAADLSAQTIGSDARLINRVMATEASPLRVDLVPALDLAGELLEATPADSRYLYIASDFRRRDWQSPERLAESLQRFSGTDTKVRMVDCAGNPAPNLGITDISPQPDVWVAGVPVVVSVTVRNYGQTPVTNVALSSRVIRYGRGAEVADPTRRFSGEVEPQPAVVIESLEGGAQVTKSFQVFVTESGTHAVEVALPEDALAIDNRRACTLPLSDVEKVLVIDGDADARGAYHVASVLDPGSQVRIGAIPEIQPPSFLRSATLETLAPYRAIYLIDLPEIGENAAAALSAYVRRGGGLAWFLGSQVQPEAYQQTLLAGDRQLLPAPLGEVTSLPPSDDSAAAGDVVLGEETGLLQPLRGGGDAAFSLVAVSKSWSLAAETPGEETEPVEAAESDPAEAPLRVREPLRRRDGQPLVTQHEVGRGRVITVLAGLDGSWTNWPGDPTFVVFLLQSNAALWSGAAPPTRRLVDEPLVRALPPEQYASEVTFLPPSQPPRVPLELSASPDPAGSADTAGGPDGDTEAADRSESQDEQDAGRRVGFDPVEMVIADEPNVSEILRPGIAEWMLTLADGRTEVVPVASVIRLGEGDLARADKAEITRALEPVEVEFIDSQVWSGQNRTAGSSALTLWMLGLLVAFLAIEQALAYWAGYHISSRSNISSVATGSGGQR